MPFATITQTGAYRTGMAMNYPRIYVSNALDEVVEREDGIAFQRLARRLLRELAQEAIPHAVHNDLGRDSTVVLNGKEWSVCASLTADWSKIETDLMRLKETFRDAGAVIFVTPRSVSNQRVKQWEERARAIHGMALKVFEREWVLDECQRPCNAFIVQETLRILPTANQGQWDILAPGPVDVVTDTAVIVNLAIAQVGGQTTIAWYEPPASDRAEAIKVKTCVPLESWRPSGKAIVGADPDLAVLDGRLIMSWQRLEQHHVHSLFASEVSTEGRITNTRVVADSVSRLRGIPKLGRVGDSLYEVYATADRSIFAAGVFSGERFSARVAERPLQVEVVGFMRSLVVIVDCDSSLEVFILSANGFQLIKSVTFGNIGRLVDRWSAAVAKMNLVLAVEVRPHTLCTTTLNLVSGEISPIWPICRPGSFPALWGVGGGFVAFAWAGIGPLPLELQGDPQMLDISAKISKARMDRNRPKSEGRALHHERLLGWIEPFRHVWLGVLDDVGRCHHHYGPIERNSTPSFGCTLSGSGDRITLVWRQGEDAEHCQILACSIGVNAVNR